MAIELPTPRLNRKTAFKARLAMGNTKFHQEINAGRIPPPDGWLGPRSPVWTEESVLATIRSYLDVPKPPETHPAARRRKLAAQSSHGSSSQ
jgi:hypothetical protein